jgi:hypothetical protein
MVKHITIAVIGVVAIGTLILSSQLFENNSAGYVQVKQGATAER